jgi:hypothetical protein
MKPAAASAKTRKLCENKISLVKIDRVGDHAVLSAPVTHGVNATASFTDDDGGDSSDGEKERLSRRVAMNGDCYVSAPALVTFPADSTFAGKQGHFERQYCQLDDPEQYLTDDFKVARNTKEFILKYLADEDPSISDPTAYFVKKYTPNSPVVDTATHSWDNPDAVDTVASSDDNSGEDNSGGAAPSSITEDHHTDSDTPEETANGFESVPKTDTTPTAPAGTSNATEEAATDPVIDPEDPYPDHVYDWYPYREEFDRTRPPTVEGPICTFYLKPVVEPSTADTAFYEYYNGAQFCDDWDEARFKLVAPVTHEEAAFRYLDRFTALAGLDHLPALQHHFRH